MKKLILVPALLVAACGLDQPTEDQVVASNEGEHDDMPDVPDAAPDARAFTAGIMINPITCESTVAQFEAFARYSDDGSPVADIACTWTFDDGMTSNDCTGEHPFAVAGSHDFMLEVTDLSTGAVAVAMQTRQFHPPLEATLDVSTDGLTISYKAMSNTGGEQHVTISPAELVLDADVNDLERTVMVSEAGTYTIEFDVEDERGVAEICTAHVTREVTVVCDDPDHMH